MKDSPERQYIDDRAARDRPINEARNSDADRAAHDGDSSSRGSGASAAGGPEGSRGRNAADKLDRGSSAAEELDRGPHAAEELHRGAGAAEDAHDASERQLFPSDDQERFHGRWRDIQTNFVDDPRRAVEDADALVGEVTDRLVSVFARNRDELERQWTAGEDVSTEDLRRTLQQYRAFFERLLGL